MIPPLKPSLTREARDYVMIALGMILYGIGWTVFLLPNNITTGGVPGIASIIYFASGFPVQYTYFIINFLLLVLSIRILGWKFCIKTVYAVCTLTFFLYIIQHFTKDIVLLKDQPFMACASDFTKRRLCTAISRGKSLFNLSTKNVVSNNSVVSK